ncbi:MAG: FGGY-family carbohydrate kinase [Caldilineaceae bacterium SB0662_bin_25]|nr:FGGY-family carbohydrate kinase [Caldilineaceae bacterium SB0662_bin_25]
MIIGLDIGTTSLSAVVLDPDSGSQAAHRTVANRAGSFPGSGRAEMDLAQLYELAVECLAGLVAQADLGPSDIQGIGVTGQQHGVALIRPDATPAGPAITWQDLRVQEPLPGSDRPVLERFIAAAGGREAFRNTGCLPAAGFLGPSLYWLSLQDALPDPPVTACFVPDAVVSFLTETSVVCEPTLAGSSGIFDIRANCWDSRVLERLALPAGLFPSIGGAGDVVGGLRRELAEAVGLEPGTPVTVALGDNQASFIGSAPEPGRSLLLNVGTGGQISARTDSFHFIPGLENRPFPGRQYLLIGGGLFGGRSYAYLQGFFQQVGAGLLDTDVPDDLYERMTELAATVPAGSDGLRCEPFFTGSRTDPGLRATFRGLSPDNFTPAHFARALLEGMADGFFTFFEQMQPVVGVPPLLVGAGNGVRQNRLLAQILARRFGKTLLIPSHAEEAAVGAAVAASVGLGIFGDLETAAAALLGYADAVEP